MNYCVFCKIVNRELPAEIIDETDKVVVILALENHPLVVTRKHIKDVYELDEETGAEVMKETIKVARATKEAIRPDGINLVQANELAAHQEVFHFHLHIKPRWHNDDVQMHWEPEAIDESTRAETRRKIVAALRKQSNQSPE